MDYLSLMEAIVLAQAQERMPLSKQKAGSERTKERARKRKKKRKKNK